MAEHLVPLGESGARVSAQVADGEYRAARRRAKALQRDGIKLRKARLLNGVRMAADQQARLQTEEGTGDGMPRPPEDLDELLASHVGVSKALGELAGLLGVASIDGTRADVIARLRALRADVATLGRLPELHRLRDSLEQAGLRELIDDLASWHADVDGSLDTLEYALMASIVDDVRLNDVRVGGFDGRRHERAVDEFQDADQRHVATTAQRVRRLAAERAVRSEDQHPEQAMLIKREAAKKTRHRPVRETFSEATDVMTAVKPCWVMSPLVVSQVLPNDRPYFDVVIFDEASQVRPAEAIPAIARGRRLVVAGDEQQLPPTDFFSGPTIDSDDDGDASLSQVVCSGVRLVG